MLQMSKTSLFVGYARTVSGGHLARPMPATTTSMLTKTASMAIWDAGLMKSGGFVERLLFWKILAIRLVLIRIAA